MSFGLLGLVRLRSSGVRRTIWTGVFGGAALLCSFPHGAQGAPRGGIQHVVIQINENKDYADAFNLANAPYLTALIQSNGAIATNFYADTHPSIGNYFELLTGQILTNNDAQTPSSLPISIDNLIRQINAAGYSWKAYCESIPSVGYTGGDTGEYAVRHCAIPYLTDVQNDAAQKQKLVDFPQFATDLQNSQLPTFSFVIPNLINDVHDSDIPTGDNWIKNNMAQLFNASTFYQDTIYIFTWDEAGTDNAYGGGRIETAFLGAHVKQAYAQTLSGTLYQQASTGATILWLLGISPPADMHDIVSAPVMSEFFDFSSCMPTAVCPAPYDCDTYTDGCGGTINCGICTGPDTCGGGGAPKVCGNGASPRPNPPTNLRVIM